MKVSKRRSTWRDGLVETCIASAVATVTAFLVVALLRSAIKPADSLAFLGAGVGAGLAVLGTLWVERWKRDEFDRRQQSVLKDLLFEFRELLCQAIYREEPSSQPPIDVHNRFNERGRFIEEIAALAETLDLQLGTFDAPNGSVLRTAVRLRRELVRQDYLRDPEGYKKKFNITPLHFIPRFYEHAEARGPILLESVDNFIGALQSHGIGGIGPDAFERTPHPQIEIM